MSVFGIGAFYDGKKDVSEDFLQNERACVGWDETSAPTLHRITKQMKAGDVIFIKSYPPGGSFYIKAVGVVRGPAETDGRGPGPICVPVDWSWKGELEVESISDKYNVRRNTLFEEFNAEVVDLVLDALLYKTDRVRGAGERVG